jgi:glutamate carboxypeptidase
MLSFIDERQPEMLALLERIVNIDSGTFDKAGVDRVGALLSERLEALGFSIERVPQGEHGDHIVARKQGTMPRRVLFIGHMDTVFQAGTVAARPFRVQDGIAYGPGVIDMKGGLVSLLYALEALRQAHPATYREMDMAAVFNSDEEILSPTSRPVIEREARQAHATLVFEPARPGGEYVVARKGVGRYRLSVAGRAAHAGSQPERGRNAVADIAHKIVAIHALANPSAGTTVSVNVVHGGERTNVIAERAYAEVDLRVTSLEEAERVETGMREIATTAFVPDTTTEMTGGLLFPPMSQTPGSERLFRAVQAAGRQLGLELSGILSGGGSDGNHTSQFTPTVDGMGPRGGDGHSDREWMEISSLVERTKVTALLLSAWPEVAGTIEA